ncbi:MAG: hypothetical protein MJ025_05170 [Victivallaceae bacterium]|nr:hypothetical protein [Victivallaceae bacterium]
MTSEIAIIAIGGAGCKFMKELTAIPGGCNLKLMAIDTDAKSLFESGLPSESTILAMPEWTNSIGCCGDAQLGNRCIFKSGDAIRSMIRGCQLLVIIGGLGGGTSSGGISPLLDIAKKANVQTCCILSMPFTHESAKVKRLADNTLNQNVAKKADAVIAMPNDLLFSVMKKDTPLDVAFETATKEFSRSVWAITEVLVAGNQLNADFRNLRAMLNGRISRCSLGIGMATGDGPGKVETAVENLLKSPMFGGPDWTSRSDAVIFTVLGGPDLSIGDTKLALDMIDKFLTCRNADMLKGAAMIHDESWRGRIQLSCVSVIYDRIASMPPPVAPTVERYVPIQPDLPMININEKGAMDGTIKVCFKGEDLDEPTFRRKQIKIKDYK